MQTKSKKAGSKATGPALIAAAGYIRMSTDQQDASPERQRAEVVKLADRDGYRIVRWYEDDGLTGTESLNRPEFQRLLADAQKGDFRAVLMYEQSRFSREDVFDVMLHWRLLRSADVDLVTCQRGKLDLKSLGGIITAIVDQHGAHDESRKIADRTVSGNLHRIRQGKRASGSAIFGFDKLVLDESGKEVRRVAANQRFMKPKKWTFKLVRSSDPATVSGVRWAFDSARRGVSLQLIAIGLNERGLRTPTGRLFCHQAVKRMLINPVYAGVLRAGFWARGKFRRMNEEGVQLIPDAHDAFITSEMFRDVQLKVKALGHVKQARTAGRYLLSGVLICDHCGAPMYGKISYSTLAKRELLSYSCTRAIPKGRTRCDGPNVSADLIERYILKLIGQELLKPEVRSPLLGSSRRRSSEKQISFDESRLEQLRRDIVHGEDNLARADGENFGAIAKRLDLWRAQEKELVERMTVEAAESTAPGNFEWAMRELAPACSRLCDSEGDALACAEERTTLSAALRATIKEIRIGCRRIAFCRQTARLLFGIVLFQPAVHHPEGAIPFQDSDIHFDRQWWKVVRLIREAGTALTCRQISERMGYKGPCSAETHIYRAIAAGAVMKNPHGHGFLPVQG